LAETNNPNDEPGRDPQPAEPAAEAGPDQAAEAASDARRAEQPGSDQQASPPPEADAASKPVEPAAADEPGTPAPSDIPEEPEGAAGPSQPAAEAASQQPESQTEPSPEARASEPEPAPSEAPADETAGEPQSQDVEASKAKREKAPKTPKTPAKAKKRDEEKPPEEPKSENMDWYILKVQSNREDSIRDGLMRRVAVAGLQRYFGDVIVPTEQVAEFKGGKKRIAKRKLYPGYLVVQMEINEDTWYLVRETPGIGDFTGAARRPTPMLPHEVARILATKEEVDEKAPKPRIKFTTGDRVKINEGTFENFEGEVQAVDETNGRVTVLLQIFNRPTPVELEYWQIESV